MNIAIWRYYDALRGGALLGLSPLGYKPGMAAANDETERAKRERERRERREAGGKLLRGVRLRENLNQTQLAAIADSDQSNISDWETGAVALTVWQLDRLLNAMGYKLTLGVERSVEPSSEAGGERSATAKKARDFGAAAFGTRRGALKQGKPRRSGQ